MKVSLKMEINSLSYQIAFFTGVNWPVLNSKDVRDKLDIYKLQQLHNETFEDIVETIFQLLKSFSACPHCEEFRGVSRTSSLDL